MELLVGSDDKSVERKVNNAEINLKQQPTAITTIANDIKKTEKVARKKKILTIKEKRREKGQK